MDGENGAEPLTYKDTLMYCWFWVWIKLTLKAPEKLQLYGFYVYYVVHICDFGMLRVNMEIGMKAL